MISLLRDQNSIETEYELSTDEFAGKVALITGGARGQGRSHALAFAEQGADIAICDRCADSESVGYPLGTEAELAETKRMVEELGRKCFSGRVDTSDRNAMNTFVSQAEKELGGIDIAVANAGVSSAASITDHPQALWDEVIGTNLTGVFNTLAAVAPGMAERGYGRIVTISSMLGRSSAPNQVAYGASKWGVIGMSKSAAQDLAHSGVTVNVITPGNIDTPMVKNERLYSLVRPDLESPTWDDVGPLLGQLHVQPIAVMDSSEVSRVVLFLAAEASAHLTGIVVPVDAGWSTRTGS
ncbi:mycofactocin-coupled SDR family oxidoreductase [Rhodococcus sp. H29-C3]|uniref:mycofactocin-coupled SDR family oxidoreductase n=1 Tax=Rhodococcus sp. H29-C3 TaxID=3046307 RepID=UPI0024B9100C|nr:mycofactocin-coupled SDR family oxidoreductase [Rhodococcus sp. H29-C3]MDJ0359837.1 mycofactocin-coupled SDR family oxidoreductase [Rhodococcus sp. H29-C3]